MTAAKVRGVSILSAEIRIPMLSMGMTEGILKEWLVEDGSTVQEGMAIYSLESDKAIEEVQSPGAGVLRIAGKIGETYPVGELIGTIE
jgi:pyruvate/2-oxoglutarate dehydrogenase complex dihydrolipoamide acyltransferase (E2) component